MSIKIPRKHAHFVLGALIGTVMAFVMSLVITYLDLGPVNAVLWKWAETFLFAFVIAVPVGVLATPILTRIVEYITEHP